MKDTIFRLLCVLGVLGVPGRESALNRTLLSDSRSHAAKNARPTTRKITPAGTHMTRPASCWSSSGVKPHARLVAAYAGYQTRGENVSSAPRTPEWTPVANT